MRMPCEYFAAWPLAFSCSFTCGRKPCTSTTFTPMLWISARSCAMFCSFPAAMASPAMATTNVLPRCMWMYGATERNHGTNVKLKTADIAESVRHAPAEAPVAPPAPQGYGGAHATPRGRVVGRVLRHGDIDDRRGGRGVPPRPEARCGDGRVGLPPVHPVRRQLPGPAADAGRQFPAAIRRQPVHVLRGAPGQPGACDDRPYAG